ncbi:hypothetical protein [Nannocystis bainbridge]|uniref:Uncharacterized protein n=1 Tax=Nannocystis bainbridge TaxID=2995303 RepID=A0ABT5DTB8_9BACT|nr:hypothetical protein [Nannocystis bainbridge]MDC0715968.1 hypothetical protein [Nannocystis bainbridge]
MRQSPPADAIVCGRDNRAAHLEAFVAGRLRGSIEGSVRRCRALGDILDDTGVAPYPFEIRFDPNEEPPRPPRDAMPHHGASATPASSRPPIRRRLAA